MSIPAWKRIGLRLKYAQEDATGSDHDRNVIAVTGHNTPESRDSRTKRKSSSDGASKTEHGAKRVRTTDERSPSPAVGSDAHTASKATSNDVLRRKKSVSFASDTKTEDGDTAQSIQFIAPISIDVTSAKPSREQGPAVDRSPKRLDSRAPKKSSDALEYLTQHYRERQSWKFNKNREVWILKHALSINDLPVDHNAALCNYIYGLKSTAARDRLIEACRKDLSESNHDQMKSSEDSESHAEFLATLVAHLSTDRLAEGEDASERYAGWLKSQDRSRIVLWSLAEPTDKTSESILGKKIRGRPPCSAPKAMPLGSRSAASIGNGLEPIRVKKSKARTSRIELESDSSSESSSESSSDSSSDSSDSDDSTGNHGALNHRTSNTKNKGRSKLENDLHKGGDETSEDSSDDTSSLSSHTSSTSSSGTSDSSG